MKAIIAPIDFSTASLNAARYAADLAYSMQAPLVLFHICIIPLPVSEVPIPIEHMDETMADAEKEIRSFKEELENKYGGSLTITTEVRVGIFLAELQQFCEEIHPAAVVVGPNGTGELERFFFGSNTLKAISGIKWPVLIIPEGAVFTSVRKIGIACDLRAVAESVPVSEIKNLIQHFKAELHVLHVSNDMPGPLSAGLQPAFSRLKELLADLNPSCHFMCRDDIDKGICEFAEKIKLDILIVIPHKHSLFGGIFHKSHTKALVLSSHMPILSIHE